MFNTPFQAIDRERIESLIANGVRESLTLDYKELLHVENRDQKKEFLADVSAFANAAGGVLIYGVSEKREGGKTTGLPEKAIGLPGVNADAITRQLESILADGLEPRINGLKIKAVEGFESGPVIVLRVPKSYLAPHMIKQGESRFYSRFNGGKQPLDVTQIRSAFALSDRVPEKVRRFRDERIGRIIAGETPVSLPDRPNVVLHILPITSLDPATQIDLSVVKGQGEDLRPINAYTGWSGRHNLDGYLTQGETGDPRRPTTYLQIFRNGAMEAVEATLLFHNNANNPLSAEVPQNLIGTIACERMLIVALDRFLKIQKATGIEPPLLIMLTLTGMKGYGLIAELLTGQLHRFDRDVLMLPEAMMESFDEFADKLLQPAFDALWQGAGKERCLHYKERESRWSDTSDGKPPI